ncbi:SusC/RagA family TonB-linked outer membrane protein [Pseudoflavitalea sp. G-6-1-2]|uniref:SusC/RagA family TonB-linked outer membrane protein n=1 Tax=Pseudoflavitalea sp. G-6-1-2 TaxID=2728841 RepID=UPI00146D416B|nr:SusC/RagA family TonB-linked outer membrane protein [Pseudoflavitalea sp. G-6-1-2]NML21984.1 SusC/RagA family TonB-linked outer membrane protein [Pseudoflavitalea sp. G-6-1-2]
MSLKNCCRAFYALHSLTLLLLLFSPPLIAQEPQPATQQKISGMVKDSLGTPIPNVSVLEKGVKSNGTTTDHTGMFTLVLKGNSKMLVFSTVGYVTQEVNFAGKTSVIVTMESDKKSLTDVVVIGYQEVSRRKSSAAIATVKGEVIANLPAPSVDMLLQGRVSGVNVQNSSGEPGIRNTLVVRGNTSVMRGYDEARALSTPLYVVDGIPLSVTDFGAYDNNSTQTNQIAGINPNDIESIDILKDASAAAIYGSRGSNGVIIIKTKRAKTGKPEINFNAYTGITQKPELMETMAGAEERRMKMAVIQLYNKYDDNESLPMMLTDSLNPAFNNATDWQNMFYKQGIVSNFDLSISGSNEAINYRLSLGHYKEDGIVRNTGYKRYSVLATIGAKVTPWLQNMTRIRIARQDRPRSTNERTGGFFAFDTYQMPSSFFALTDNSRDYLLGNNNRTDKNIDNSLQVSTAFIVDILKNLHFNTTLNYETTNANRDYYQPSVVRDNEMGIASSFSSKREYITMFNTLDFTQNFGEHRLNVIAGQNVEYTQYKSVFGEADLIPNDYVWRVIVANKNYSRTQSAIQETGLQSIFSRVNYDFKGRYLLSAVANFDASSKFGKENRWGFFPSVSAGWIISDEPFMQNRFPWLSFLKLRGSYGVTGTQPERNYLGYNNYIVNKARFDGNDDATSYNGVPVITPDYKEGIAQKSLSWEESKQGNIGIEAGFFDGRIRIIADAYNRSTSKGFFNYLLPVASGYTQAMTNAIGLRNSGIELTLNTRNLPSKSALQWYTDVTFSFNKNVITALPNGGRNIIFNTNSAVFGEDYLLSVGLPANQYYVFKYAGIYSQESDIPFNLLTGKRLTGIAGWDLHPGDPILIDQDGNFEIREPMDYIIGGDPNPKYYGGIMNTFTWKGFSLGVFLNFTFGRDIMNSYLNRRLHYLFEESGDQGENQLAYRAMMDIDKLNYWKKPGDKADFPTFTLVNNQRAPYRFFDKTTMYIEDGSYLRVKNITVGYTFHPRLLSRLKLKRLRIYGMVDNLVTFQRSSIPDAEAVNAYGVYTGDGYPIPKKFTFGIDLGL